MGEEQPNQPLSKCDGFDHQYQNHSAQISASEQEEDNNSNDLDAMMQMERERQEARLTCDVLCSLSAHAGPPSEFDSHHQEGSVDDHDPFPKRKSNKAACPKQLQLPMFLSKTYHMIDRCDPTIATWSEAGDNFVVKNVDRFASSVLPLYFKHSNFSSFARQLNFYGFRKLRTDPILTTDIDPQTCTHVRFYHEYFQRDKPELLHNIRRATKTDQQAKDDVDSLKHEVAQLRDALSCATNEYERRLAEMSYDFNRRLSASNAEVEKLAAIVQRVLANQQQQNETSAAAAALTELPSSIPPRAPTPPEPISSLLQSRASHGLAPAPLSPSLITSANAGTVPASSILQSLGHMAAAAGIHSQSAPASGVQHTRAPGLVKSQPASSLLQQNINLKRQQHPTDDDGCNGTQEPSTRQRIM